MEYCAARLSSIGIIIIIIVQKVIDEVLGCFQYDYMVGWYQVLFNTA